MSASGLAEIAIGLGSNLEDRVGNIISALHALAALDRVRLLRVSSLYESEPWGETDQPRFLNAVALAATDRDPFDLLFELKQIEQQLGRKPGPRWGARLIDLDLLFHGDTRMSGETLTLPHASMFERLFVLIPLAEVLNGRPAVGRNLGEAIARLREPGGSDPLWRHPETDRVRHEMRALGLE